MSPMAQLGAAGAAFIGTHLVMSHPLRRPLVSLLGEGGFRILYSVVALATFGWMIHTWMAVPATAPAYVPGDLVWGIATAVMWFASVLLAGSFFGNPALPAPPGIAASAARRDPMGVFAITRHPMMWSFALWGIVHTAIWPTPENHALAGIITLMALIGSAGQDLKKARLMADAWMTWRRRTSFFPFAGQLTGQRGWHVTWPGWGVLGLGTLIWLIATWAHTPLGGRVAAGVWRWVG